MHEYCGSGCMCAFEAHGWGWPPSKWSLGEAGMHHHHVIGQGWSLEWSSLDKSSLVGTIGVGYVGLGLLMMAHHRHR